MRWLIGFLLGITCPTTPGFGQALEAPPAAVPGLTLPAAQKVQAGEGFVVLAAESKGQVEWLVVGPGEPRVKYVPAGNQVVVSVPPVACTVQVFAVALVDGKLTPFARTVITVEGARPPPGPAPAPPGPQPTPTPAPTPPPAPVQPIAGKLYVTVVLDFGAMTPPIAAVVNDRTLRQGLQQANCVFGVYPTTSPVLTQRKLAAVVNKVGGAPALIVQTENGAVVDAEKLPATAAAVLAVVQRLRKGG